MPCLKVSNQSEVPMKRCIILSAILTLISISPVFSQGPPELYPFSMKYDPSLTLLTVMGTPYGYERYPESKMSYFQAWVTNLPLLPLDMPVARWDRPILMSADSVGGVIDFGIGTEHQTDFGIALQLIMEFHRATRTLGNYPLIINTGDTLTFDNWLTRKYSFNSRGKLIFKDVARRADTSLVEYYRFLEFILGHTNGRSLLKNLVPIGEKDVAPGTLYIQFKKDLPDTMGHTAIILDVCTDSSGTIYLLVGWGGYPARSFYIARPWPVSDRIWFTIDELKKHLQEYGDGKFYRYAG
jgi:hypothetical protein